MDQTQISGLLAGFVEEALRLPPDVDVDAALAPGNLIITPESISFSNPAPPTMPPRIYPGYTAPEGYLHPPGEPGRVYLVGALGSLMLTGAPPPDARYRPGPLLPEDGPLARVINRATAIDPAARYPSLAVLREAFAEAARGGAPAAEAPAPPQAPVAEMPAPPPAMPPLAPAAPPPARPAETVLISSDAEAMGEAPAPAPWPGDIQAETPAPPPAVPPLAPAAPPPARPAETVLINSDAEAMGEAPAPAPWPGNIQAAPVGETPAPPLAVPPLAPAAPPPWQPDETPAAPAQAGKTVMPGGWQGETPPQEPWVPAWGAFGGAGATVALPSGGMDAPAVQQEAPGAAAWGAPGAAYGYATPAQPPAWPGQPAAGVPQAAAAPPPLPLPENPPKKKGARRAVLVICLLLLLAALGVGGFFGYRALQANNLKTAWEAGDYAAVVSQVEAAPHLLEANQQAWQYSRARLLEQDGDVNGALALYDELGNFEDSIERARALRYAEATKALEGGDLSRATGLYTQLGNYKDSAQILEQLRLYQEAARIESPAERYLAYLDMDGFLDSAEKAEAAATEAYDIAMQDYEDSFFYLAVEGFETLGDYREAAAYLEMINVWIATSDAETAVDGIAPYAESLNAGPLLMSDFCFHDWLEGNWSSADGGGRFNLDATTFQFTAFDHRGTYTIATPDMVPANLADGPTFHFEYVSYNEIAVTPSNDGGTYHFTR